MLIVLSTITTNKSVVFYEFNDINGHGKTLKQLQYFVVFIKNKKTHCTFMVSPTLVFICFLTRQ